MPLNPKVYYVTDNPMDACSVIRLTSPFNSGKVNYKIIKDCAFPQEQSDETANLLVFQRNFAAKTECFETIKKLAKRNNTPLVYDIDDLLFDLPEDHPERKSHYYTKSLLPILESLALADLVTVTTDLLRQAVLPFNQNVEVLPNFFDDSLWHLQPPMEKNGDDPVVIGYMGTDSHSPDIHLIEDVLIRIIKEHKDSIRVVFWGIHPPRSLSQFEQIKWFPPVPSNYPNFVKYFQTQKADIFLSPLQDNPFNRAKSSIKFFEYTSLGAPGVFAKLPPYEKVIESGKDGFLAGNPDDWYACIEELINHSSLRVELARNAQTKIKEQYLLSKNAHLWLDTYEDLLHRDLAELRGNKKQAPILETVNRQYDQLWKDNASQIEKLNNELQSVNQKFKNELQSVNEAHKKTVWELEEIKRSKTWKFALLLRKAKVKLIPRSSKRERVAKLLFYWLQGERIKHNKAKSNKGFSGQISLSNSDNKIPSAIPIHKNPVDIIICIHNALPDVMQCLESIEEKTSNPYSVILVDDGSGKETASFLDEITGKRPAWKLIRNNPGKGYTFAANLGIKASTSPFFVLLNSDTIVSDRWIDRLMVTIVSDEKIAAVGPLSNTASWQSVPKLSESGDWAANELPSGITVDKMAENVAKYSGFIHPEVPLLNGFCMLLRKSAVEEVGLLDEENFGTGYGEEDDLMIRLQSKGWKVRIVDDAYVFHAQSKSFSSEKRLQLSRINGERLTKKHGVLTIADHVDQMQYSRVLAGIRARVKVGFEREDFVKKGREMFSSKRVLFLLPVVDSGGGANVIINEALKMRDMDVDVQIFNLPEYRFGFLQNYPMDRIPYIFKNPTELPTICSNFDAVIASANYSVPWLEPVSRSTSAPILAYYVQGFEPLMYKDGSKEYQRALGSYTLIPDMKLFSKTLWTKHQVEENTRQECKSIGISVDIDRYRPRINRSVGQEPVNLTAMIRPSSPYRSPELTMEVLAKCKKLLKSKVNVFLFGANDVREVVPERYLDFDWVQLGKLDQNQVSQLLNQTDIFADYSSHQAMGLTALEAMACGNAVIVPENGGAIEFVIDRENGLIVNTADRDHCINSTIELIRDQDFRRKLQLSAISDISEYYIEKASFNILDYLFNVEPKDG
jgi:GT2 family glycosyltransferase/glycosyltransferase involved in cell wall biosynthesis